MNTALEFVIDAFSIWTGILATLCISLCVIVASRFKIPEGDFKRLWYVVYIIVPLFAEAILYRFNLEGSVPVGIILGLLAISARMLRNQLNATDDPEDFWMKLFFHGASWFGVISTILISWRDSLTFENPMLAQLLMAILSMATALGLLSYWCWSKISAWRERLRTSSEVEEDAMQ